jgi:hypothetical protein
VPAPTAEWDAARDVWVAPDRIDLFSGDSAVYWETWPTSGMTRSGTAYPPPTSAPPTNDSGCSSPPPPTLLPTPRATDGSKGGPNPRSSGDLMLPSAAARLLPTPTVSDRHGPGHSGTGGLDLRTAVCLLPHSQGPGLEGLRPEPARGRPERGVTTHHVDWGVYTAAVRRWERIIGRPAPIPRVAGPRGGLKLNPALCEWMQGFPPGWFTAVPGIGVNDALRLAGNSVNPAQAAAALRRLLPALDAHSIEQEGPAA